MENKRHYIGLTDSEVENSRSLHGENMLPIPKKESLWKQFFEKFEDPIIRILLVALILSLGVSFYHYFSLEDGLRELSAFLEPLGILLAVLLASGIGFAFEVSANRKFDILNQVGDETSVKVIRNNNVREVLKKELVVGDIIILETGEEIPADGLLLEAVSLQINESTLTGEPLIKKSTNPSEFKKEATYPTNEVYRGTTIIEGHGIVEVKKVGRQTEYGKVYEGSQIDNKVETPLNKQLKRLGELITYGSYAIAAIIIISHMVIYFAGNKTINWIDASSYILNTIMIAVTVIVVAVPEGLPMSVTLSLALSMKRMLQTNNLVRKMHACETMGASTVICTDKTGTLTQNQMRIHKTDFKALENGILTNNDISTLIKEGIASNSTAYLDCSDINKIKTLGNPTEAALLLWLHDQGVNYLEWRENAEIINQLTFSTERKYMATLVKSSSLNKKILYIKGAPEIVFGKCKNVLIEDGHFSPTSDHKETIEDQLVIFQKKAMRTLGFAYLIVDEGDQCFVDGKLKDDLNLTFMGIVAISDPVRADVPEAVQTCIRAGIMVKIVTGDTQLTAKEIGRQIGLWSESDTDRNHMTGVEFEAKSDTELLDRVLDLKILSRARPMDKERLVKLLQQKDQVVAVTGDGTNDAPALNAAQVGLSMGDGTSVAKEASAITILDNSFNSITQALMWGRSLYQNIQRFILFQMTINLAACITVLIGAFIGTESPLTVTQMLWVNLIMDTFAALALASLPPNENVMNDKPRKTTEHIITRKMAIDIIGMGLFFVLLLFGLMQYFRHEDIASLTEFNIRDYFTNFFNFSYTKDALTPYELSLFFTIFVLLQFWNMFNAKAFNTQKSAFHNIRESLKGFGLVATCILVGQYLIVTFGGKMFNVVPLSMVDWGIVIGVTSLVLWIGEIIRLFKNR